MKKNLIITAFAGVIILFLVFAYNFDKGKPVSLKLVNDSDKAVTNITLIFETNITQEHKLPDLKAHETFKEKYDYPKTDAGECRIKLRYDDENGKPKTVILSGYVETKSYIKVQYTFK